MKIIHVSFVLGSVLGACLLSGCESKPLTPREKQIYQNEQAELQYENQQRLDEIEYQQGDEPTDDPQIDP